MKFFIPFLLALTFSLHAAQEDSTTLPENPSTAINDDEASFSPDNDQETDLPLKEKENRYIVVSQKNSSPLMMFSEKENSEKKPLSVKNLTEQQRKNSEYQDPSAAITRSPHSAAISETGNNTPSKPILPELSSLLFKTLIYCPNCKQWQTGANISKKQLPQILFIKNEKTDFWHPLYCQNEQTASSLPSRASIGQKKFQFVVDAYGEKTLHHPNPTTGVLEKSFFQDPINELPSISYWTYFLLQTHSLMPDALAHSLLTHALEQEQNTLKTIALVQKNEKNPLLPKGVVPTSYFSTSTEN